MLVVKIGCGPPVLVKKVSRLFGLWPFITRGKNLGLRTLVLWFYNQYC